MEAEAKIDTLIEVINEQNERLSRLEAAQSNGANAGVDGKLDEMLEYLQDQKRIQLERDELKQDMLPIANQMIRLTIDELAEVGEDFQLEDLLFLVKRLLRDVQLIHGMLDRLESTIELVDETKLIGQEVFNEAVVKLDQMEQAGYFEFIRGGGYVMERIVSEFDQEDIKLLGDNIVTILKTVRNLTQPEIMELTNNAITAIQDDPEELETPSTWAVLKELSDPQVRKGMIRFLNVLKAMSESPTVDNRNN